MTILIQISVIMMRKMNSYRHLKLKVSLVKQENKGKTRKLITSPKTRHQIIEVAQIIWVEVLIPIPS